MYSTPGCSKDARKLKCPYIEKPSVMESLTQVIVYHQNWVQISKATCYVAIAYVDSFLMLVLEILQESRIKN